jgi:sugar fermentation stimulation protein A
MLFSQPLQPARLLRRYRRFLADVELPNGKALTVHCPNTGSMLGCNSPGAPVMISRSANPKRKYAHTLEMIEIDGGWVGINTSRTNGLVREMLEDGVF